MGKDRYVAMVNKTIISLTWESMANLLQLLGPKPTTQGLQDWLPSPPYSRSNGTIMKRILILKQDHLKPSFVSQKTFLFFKYLQISSVFICFSLIPTVQMLKLSSGKQMRDEFACQCCKRKGGSYQSSSPMVAFLFSSAHVCKYSPFNYKCLCL